MNKRELQKKETLELLRNIIDELVKEQGYENITIRGICSKAGVSTGVFYYYYKNKEDILFDRYVRAQQIIKQYDYDVLQKTNPFDALKRYVSFHMDFIITRLPNLAMHYHKALITEYSSWQEKVPDEHRNITTKYFKKAQDMDLITMMYSAEQLSDMLRCMTNGIRYTSIMQQDIIMNCRFEEQIFDWLDSLKK